MIQRIQSVYLLLAALAGVLLFVFPVITVAPETHQEAATAVYQITGIQVDKIDAEGSNLHLRPWTVLITNSLIVVMSVFLVFQYKNRPLQLRLTRLLFLLILVQVILLVIGAEKIKAEAGAHYALSFPLGALLPALQLVFVKLAADGINRDEKLVRSADRLR